MTILDRLRRSGPAGLDPLATGPRAAELRSPWTVGALSRIVAHDVFGTTEVPLTRAEAMSVPAVARARHLLCGAVARSPLVLFERDAPAPVQPAWLSAAPGSTPWHRAAWTVDDMLFGGWSLWAVQREDGPESPITDATRVPAASWDFDPDGQVVYTAPNGGAREPVAAASCVLIGGPHEGLLELAAHTLRTARRLEDTVADRATNPVPMTELHETEPRSIDTTERDELLTMWREARQRRGGSVGFTPASIEVRTHGESEGEFLINARNAAAIDAARHCGVPAAMVDASNVNSTLTYETLQGRNLEFVDHSVSLFTDPLAARLSLDDVCAPGLRVVCDTSALTASPPSPTGPTRED